MISKPLILDMLSTIKAYISSLKCFYTKAHMKYKSNLQHPPNVSI